MSLCLSCFLQAEDPSGKALKEQQQKFAALLTAINKEQNLMANRNAEIRFKWLTVSMHASYTH